MEIWPCWNRCGVVEEACHWETGGGKGFEVSDTLISYQHSVPFIVSVGIIAAGESSHGSIHSSCLSHSGVGKVFRHFYTFIMGITKSWGKSLGSLTRLLCFSFLKILLMLKAKNAEG